MARLLRSLPVGALVKDVGTTYNGQPIVWLILEHEHKGDPEGSTALIAQKIITFKSFDAKEPKNSDNNRKEKGNNRYLYSNLLQWLNSDAAEGTWYKAQHSADAAPINENVMQGYNEYDEEKGFLANFSNDLKKNIFSVTKKTVKSDIDGGVLEDVQSKIFLLSNIEVRFLSIKLMAEGSPYKFFEDNSRAAYPTLEAIRQSEAKIGEDLPYGWWLRTPGSMTYCESTNAVSSDGDAQSSKSAYQWNGVRPAFTASSNIYVTDTPDNDGIYTILWNLPPVISTDDRNLGNKNTPFSINYTVYDPDADSVNVTIDIDNSTVQTIQMIDQSKTYTYMVNKSTFDELENGDHTITITATDDNGNVSNVVINFIKTIIPIIITGTDISLGNIWQQPAYTYQISSGDTSKAFSIVEAFNDITVREITDASYDTDITADFTGFAELKNEETHAYTITVTDTNGSMAVRTITFTKLGDKIVFYTKAVETDEAALRIITEVNYTNDGNPAIKVEATNNAGAEIPVWEDMTKEFLARTFHTFTNKPTEGFGVSVRVTLTKNAETERIYIDSLGFSFY